MPPGERAHHTDEYNPEVHPDAPGGGGGTGHFTKAQAPIPLGSAGPDADTCYLGPSAGYMDASHCEELKPGTREETVDKNAGVRILVEVREDGMFHWEISSLDGKQSCEGLHDPKFPFRGGVFSGEYCVDIQSHGVKRSDVDKELDKQIDILKKKTTVKPPTPSKPKTEAKTEARREIILIIEHDWLTKISMARWHTFDWEHYLEPTDETIDRREKMGKPFDPDLIYPGDTFLVIRDS